MRQTAQKAGVSLGAVSNVIDEAKKISRIIYVYIDREKPATLLDIYPSISTCSYSYKTNEVIVDFLNKYDTTTSDNASYPKPSTLYHFPFLHHLF